ncbi:hypothetical protein PQ455_02900 [Sphingomonas naphthae]|uniref:Uncharacterized protein n=1 Tax=Sphingomonas naphthae TaxID=1813468 RepID=A0ABY7TLT5_9SPHN|nr:hypothetical protein [Sphingomonas naphthae]WCT74197.1 hypothetical protein PQ455_02900 [Sphingomonas naphthae]
MTSLADLARRLSRKTETGRAIRLSPEDLKLLVASGAYAALQAAAVEELKVRCLQHDEASLSTSAEISASTGAPTARTSKSSGTTMNESVSAALAQARAMTRTRD